MPEIITSLLLSILLQVRSMGNHANGNKWVMSFCSIAWYYGDSNFIIHSNSLHIQTQRMWLLLYLIQILVWLVVLIRILKWLVVKGYSFLWSVCSCKTSPLTPIQFTQVKCMIYAFNTPYLHFCLSFTPSTLNPGALSPKTSRLVTLTTPSLTSTQ